MQYRLQCSVSRCMHLLLKIFFLNLFCTVSKIFVHPMHLTPMLVCSSLPLYISFLLSSRAVSEETMFSRVNEQNRSVTAFSNGFRYVA